MECDDGTVAEVWAACHCAQDCDDLIAWLQLVKNVMTKWNKINAKAPQASKAPSGEDETAQRREVQSEPQGAVRANG